MVGIPRRRHSDRADRSGQADGAVDVNCIGCPSVVREGVRFIVSGSVESDRRDAGASLYRRQWMIGRPEAGRAADAVFVGHQRLVDVDAEQHSSRQRPGRRNVTNHRAVAGHLVDVADRDSPDDGYDDGRGEWVGDRGLRIHRVEHTRPAGAQRNAFGAVV